jgi:hypothetical protein
MFSHGAETKTRTETEARWESMTVSVSCSLGWRTSKT